MTDETAEWLRYAAADLDAAALLLETIPHLAAYHAQQATEKSIKALLIERGIAFPWTHDLSRLHQLLPSGDAVESSPVELSRLIAYATSTRYPDDLLIPTAEQAEAAVRRAEAVVAAVRARLTVQA